jgi:hypothetical protein
MIRHEVLIPRESQFRLLCFHQIAEGDLVVAGFLKVFYFK